MTSSPFLSRRDFLKVAGGLGALGIGTVAGLASCNRAPTKETVKIGILHSLSGTMAITEYALRDAAILAVDEINRAGGVLGMQIQPIVENGASDTRRFGMLGEKLLAQDRVCSIFGCCTSHSRQALLETLEKYKGLLWYPVTYEGNECTNRVIYSGTVPNQQVIPALGWLAKHGYHRIFLLGSDYVYPRTSNRVIRAHVEEYRLQIADEAYVPFGCKDFSETIAHIRAKKPDVVLSTVVGDSNRAFYHALSDAGITSSALPVMAISMAESEVRAIGTASMNGHLAAWSYFQSVDTPENNAFVHNFKQRYGERRVTDDLIEAAYFEVYLWANAVHKAGTTSPIAVRDAAEGQSFQAPQGRIQIDSRNRHLWKNFRVGQVQPDGQFKILYESGGPIAPDPWDKTLHDGHACTWTPTRGV